MATNGTAGNGGGGRHHRAEHRGVPTLSLLVILVPIVVLVMLLVVILLVVVIRHVHFGGGTSKGSCSTTDRNCMFVAHSTINFNSCSPEVQGGCLHGSNIRGGPTRPTLKGIRFQMQVFTLKEMEIATSEFSQANLIGEGVYRGVLRDNTLVAIKTSQRQGKQGERAFRSEVDLLSRLRSPYIAELLGYCADQHYRLLVYEYMPNGCLHRYLHPGQHRRPRAGLSWGSRLCIALDCARGLEFLHEHTVPSVIHRNLKCANVLLDNNFRAKLGGFGLAKVGSDKLNGLISTRVLGTTEYMAPEYASTGKLTTKSDVYSYGVILLELLTGRIPIDMSRPAGEHVLVYWALPQLTNREKVVEMVDPSLHGHYSQKDLIQVAAIAAMCVQTEAEYRPLMTDVVQSLIPLVKNLHSSSNSLRFNQSPSPKTNTSR
ncbi:probable serine/threonine-protein kinase PBL7 [Andrographis paniculata]|uniref:probable serine/threonine-protein kinase PBL7 n=1 Tax=Andrographis paniculata TaxID=175694 RepID=UPI0021E723D9|nr:probable serine/threonine-protein kinase PBL7 [Andrographis paniculata]